MMIRYLDPKGKKRTSRSQTIAKHRERETAGISGMMASLRCSRILRGPDFS